MDFAEKAALSAALLAALAAGALAVLPAIRAGARRLGRRLPLAASAALLCAFLYGGKWLLPEKGQAGAGDGIGLCAVHLEYIEDAGLTAVTVWYTSGTVSASTPVAWRNASNEFWTQCEKLAPESGSAGPSNFLRFAVSGNAESNRMWWVGGDPPPVVIETRGIRIVDFLATSRLVSIAWTCDDPGAAAFSVQWRRPGGGEWHTEHTGTETNFLWRGFSVGEDREWRVVSEYVYGEGGE